MGMGEVEPARRALAKSPVDPATLLEPKSLPYPIREYEPKTLHDLLGVGGLSSAAYSAQLLRTCCITVRNRPADTRGQGPYREVCQARLGQKAVVGGLQTQPGSRRSWLAVGYWILSHFCQKPGCARVRVSPTSTS